MKNQRRKFSSEFKSKVVLEAITERYTVTELAEKFDVHRNQISEWKKQFVANAYLVFESGKTEAMNENLFTETN